MWRESRAHETVHADAPRKKSSASQGKKGHCDSNMGNSEEYTSKMGEVDERCQIMQRLVGYLFSVGGGRGSGKQRVHLLLPGCVDCLYIPPHFSPVCCHPLRGFPGGTSGKQPACSCRRHKRVGLIPELRRSPGGGYSNPLQYSCLEKPMDEGAWQTMAHRISKSRIWLSEHTHTH